MIKNIQKKGIAQQNILFKNAIDNIKHACIGTQFLFPACLHFPPSITPPTNSKRLQEASAKSSVNTVYKSTIQRKNIKLVSTRPNTAAYRKKGGGTERRCHRQRQTEHKQKLEVLCRVLGIGGGFDLTRRCRRRWVGLKKMATSRLEENSYE